MKLNYILLSSCSVKGQSFKKSKQYFHLSWHQASQINQKITRIIAIQRNRMYMGKLGLSHNWFAMNCDKYLEEKKSGPKCLIKTICHCVWKIMVKQSKYYMGSWQQCLKQRVVSASSIPFQFANHELCSIVSGVTTKYNSQKLDRSASLFITSHCVVSFLGSVSERKNSKH